MEVAMVFIIIVIIKPKSQGYLKCGPSSPAQLLTMLQYGFSGPKWLLTSPKYSFCVLSVIVDQSVFLRLEYFSPISAYQDATHSSNPCSGSIFFWEASFIIQPDAALISSELI